MNVSIKSDTVPLVCDLDGTLTRTDTTHELVILYLRHAPFLGWFNILRWLSSGKARVKEALAAEVGGQLEESHLPYNTELMETETFRMAPHRTLVSGAARSVVENVSHHLGGFDAAVGTSGGENLTSKAKADYLARTYPDGFDYIGNSSDDLAVWAKARRAYAANATPSVIAAARSRGIDLQVLVPRTSQIRPLRKAMRLHQWAKNSLIFVVPALNLPMLTPGILISLLAIFVAFGLVASATYLLNDLLDIQEDRKHHSKSARPFAAGQLDIRTGILAIAGFLGAGLALALAANPSVAPMLLAYAAISLGYSMYLKRLVIFDAMTLAFLFCWRILVGGIALGEDPNVWFMTAVGAFFLSLAFGKRCIELERKRNLEPTDSEAVLHGRGYLGRDFPVVLGLGLVTGMVAPLIVLIYVYLSGSSIVNHNGSALSLAALLCFWIGRFWILVNRGAVQDDPIEFALKDRPSRAILIGMAAILILEQIQ